MDISNIRLWAKDVVFSLKKLGGKATTSEIANAVKTVASKQRNTKDWKSSVRNVLNDYCPTKIDYKRIKLRNPDHPALFEDLGYEGREKKWRLIISSEEIKKILNV